MLLSYCVVNTNGRDFLLACLEAIERTAPPDLEREVLVLDNASDDGSVEAVQALGRDIRLIAQDRREGKAANDSRLLAEARGEFCLLLNEDSELQPGAVAALLGALRADRRAAVAGAREGASALPSATVPRACAAGTGPFDAGTAAAGWLATERGGLAVASSPAAAPWGAPGAEAGGLEPDRIAPGVEAGGVLAAGAGGDTGARAVEAEAAEAAVTATVAADRLAAWPSPAAASGALVAAPPARGADCAEWLPGRAGSARAAGEASTEPGGTAVAGGAAEAGAAAEAMPAAVAGAAAGPADAAVAGEPAIAGAPAVAGCAAIAAVAGEASAPGT